MKSLMSVTDHALHDMAFEACKITYRESEGFDIIDVRNMVAMILKQMRHAKIYVRQDAVTYTFSLGKTAAKHYALTKSDIERTIKAIHRKETLSDEKTNS